eukprot:15441585-Alexandrium_andersonii.AAC.1
MDGDLERDLQEVLGSAAGGEEATTGGEEATTGGEEATPSADTTPNKNSKPPADTTPPKPKAAKATARGAAKAKAKGKAKATAKGKAKAKSAAAAASTPRKGSKRSGGGTSSTGGCGATPQYPVAPDGRQRKRAKETGAQDGNLESALGALVEAGAAAASTPQQAAANTPQQAAASTPQQAAASTLQQQPPVVAPKGQPEQPAAPVKQELKEEQRCQTKGANGRWGGPRGGRASDMLRAGFGPHEPLLSSADSESARANAQNAPLGSFSDQL